MNMKNLVIYLLLHTSTVHKLTHSKIHYGSFSKKEKEKENHYGHTQLVCHVSCSMLAQLKSKMDWGTVQLMDLLACTVWILLIEWDS